MTRPSNIDPGYIKSSVRIAGLRPYAFDLPSVIGRSLANRVADLVRADYPDAEVTLIEQHKADQFDLAKDLRASDRVQQQLTLSIQEPKPGESLLKGLSLLAVPAIDATTLLPKLFAERKHHSLWWAVLNEMLRNRELPEWLKRQDIGTAADFERYDMAKRDTNLVLFGTSQLLPGDDPAVLSGNSQAQIDLIEAERTFAIRWWTMLNGLRVRRQLPAWAVKRSVGHGPDIERWWEEESAVNTILFETESVREITTSARSAARLLSEAFI
ncbi:hypothetical protein M2401_005008 [Pseudomonas sp. JUb42]|uniref:hypothetical protein n=1 Tax=Pseudomonas sp. JUb42 TaxID=2940611 RepID=UPI00216A7BE8|nr:hypothetical protein [Pseudomonas sp. JUb42]MCS3471246.1 hypothetical protein [Pseudomonas sp. JUb42]